ncbi:MAG TPA: DUF5668 domain-containing protein [Terriglobales bacterium]|nr:DUF5668 domain-containing protein [Terriglobales bacterium]
MRMLAPIFLIAAAAIFMLDQAGAFGLGWIEPLFWPGLLFAFGLESWSADRRRWAAALLLSGTLLLANNFGALHWGLERFWPLALVAVGACMIVERQRA